MKEKQLKCVICKDKRPVSEMYKPRIDKLQYVCSKAINLECTAKFGLKLARDQKRKEDREFRAETRRKKEAHYSDNKKHWKEKATTVFHKWIRDVRDLNEPCISCGRYQNELKPNAMGQYWDAGHFRTKGACEELRFEPLNVHKQCKSCNGGSYYYASKKETVASEYERRLRLKLGDSKVDWLKGPHKQARMRADDYKAIYQKYKDLLKAAEL